MRKIAWFWALHFFATIAGWYLLSALAQGVVDSTTEPPALLDVLNGIMQILMFPAVTAALWVSPNLGGFRLSSFFVFLGVAAINSAIVLAFIIAIIRAVRAASRMSP